MKTEPSPPHKIGRGMKSVLCYITAAIGFLLLGCNRLDTMPTPPGVALATGERQRTTVAAPTEAQFNEQFQKHEWFTLRDEIAEKGTPLFYKGAVEAAFNQAKAENDLKKVVSQNADAKAVERAERILFHVYYRAGRYQEALVQARALKALIQTHSLAAGDDYDYSHLIATIPQLEFLSLEGDQQILPRNTSSVALTFTPRGYVMLPVKVNGSTIQCVLDNGTIPSSVSKSVADGLHLKYPHDAGQLPEMQQLRSRRLLLRRTSCWQDSTSRT
jgi:hypothetical protein